MFYERYKQKVIELLLPRIVYKILIGMVGGWHGKYMTFKEAFSHCNSYADNKIADAVLASALKALEGKGKWERDGVVFNEVIYSWPIVAGLLMASCEHRRNIGIVDFGGGFGSTYYQNKGFLPANISWSIVEQESVVERGLKCPKLQPLRFYASLEKACKENHHDALILSSVLQYLENPYDALHKMLDTRCDFVLVDRTQFSKKDTEYVSIQKVPKSIYGFRTSYPCWTLNQNKVAGIFNQHDYKLIAKFYPSTDTPNRLDEIFLGFVYKHVL